MSTFHAFWALLISACHFFASLSASRLLSNVAMKPRSAPRAPRFPLASLVFARYFAFGHFFSLLLCVADCFFSRCCARHCRERHKRRADRLEKRRARGFGVRLFRLWRANYTSKGNVRILQLARSSARLLRTAPPPPKHARHLCGRLAD